MPNRTALVVLTIVLCVTLALGSDFCTIGETGRSVCAPESTWDVATKIESPRDTEYPGLVSVQVSLTNLSDLLTLVESLHVTIKPSGYADHEEGIALAPHEVVGITLTPWVSYPGMHETCTAWITCPADSNHSNDTDVVIVSNTGISGREEMEPYAGLSLTLLPSPLAGNVLHIKYSLNQAGPASVTLFDVSGRAAGKGGFFGERAGQLSLDLHYLPAGVYLVRLDDGSRAVSQKLVVQR